MAAKSDGNARVVAHNRKARFNYEIGEVFEAGVALTGTEVKSLRQGKATIAESYADSRGGEIWLVNATIPEYLQGGRFNHAPKRPRKLLLHRTQINKLMGAIEREGQPQNRRQRRHAPLVFDGEFAVVVMLLLGTRATVISGDVRKDLQLPPSPLSPSFLVSLSGAS